MSASQRNVLVVDDEPQVRSLTCRALTKSGFCCAEAANGDEALQLATASVFDVVITDLRMPQRHGHSLCLDLLRLPAPPKVMVVTALSDARVVQDLLSRGVWDVVQKPMNYDVLAAKVAKMTETVRVAPAARPASKASAAATQMNLLQRIEKSLVELTDLFEDRLDEVFNVPGDLPEPPESVRSFIRRLAESESHGAAPFADIPGHEGRRTDRVTCYTPVVAVPVNKQFKQACEPFKLSLRDLSESGARLLHTRATNAQFLALSWTATQVAKKSIRVVTKVMRVKPCSPFYDYGVQFVMAD